MYVLLLTYDLNNEKFGSDYSGLYKIIYSYNHRKLSESSYALLTHESPDDIYNKLRIYLDDDDSIYVITLNQPLASHNPHRDEVSIWLRNHLS